jgi:outer membrane protein TolC
MSFAALLVLLSLFPWPVCAPHASGRASDGAPAPPPMPMAPNAPLAAKAAAPALPAALPPAPPATVHLSLEEAKSRALAASKLLNLANLNVQGKAYAVRAIQADYFPKVVGTALYDHFNDPLGTVVTTSGRKVSGPLGAPLLNVPAVTVNAAVLQQDSSFAMLTVVQPLTDLFKIRQGVKLAQADEQIAQAQLDKGVRALLSGVEHLYWGLLATQRIRGAVQDGLRTLEALPADKSPVIRASLIESRQALQQADQQYADLQAQLNSLLDLPACTPLELIEPPLPALSFGCADEVVNLALAASPEVREAEQDIAKAHAALCAGRLDYVPSIAVVGGYANQTVASYIQQDIGFVGVVGGYTFVDWGKRRAVVHERENLVSMANLKLAQVQDDVRDKAQKALRDLVQSWEALKLARDMLAVRQELQKQATTPEALANPGPLLLAGKDSLTAAVDAIKAELAYRQACSLLLSLIGKK